MEDRLPTATMSSFLVSLIARHEEIMSASNMVRGESETLEFRIESEGAKFRIRGRFTESEKYPAIVRLQGEALVMCGSAPQNHTLSKLAAARSKRITLEYQPRSRTAFMTVH